jgi:hypothetical protein
MLLEEGQNRIRKGKTKENKNYINPKDKGSLKEEMNGPGLT